MVWNRFLLPLRIESLPKDKWYNMFDCQVNYHCGLNWSAIMKITIGFITVWLFLADYSIASSQIMLVLVTPWCWFFETFHQASISQYIRRREHSDSFTMMNTLKPNYWS